MSGQDVLAFSDTQTITGSFNSSSGVLTLTGTDSVTNYEAALRSVTYHQNTEGDDPNLSARTISFVVNDGSAASTTLTSTVNVTAINDAPEVSASSTVSYTEGDASATVGDVTITDVDDANMASATVSLVGFVTGDLLGLTTAANGLASVNGLTVSYNAGSGVATLVGEASKTIYESVLSGLQYVSVSEDPTAEGTSTSRVLTYTVVDANSDSAGAATGSATATLSVAGVNDAPVLETGSTLAYTEDDAATVINDALTLNDDDDSNLESATISISAGFVSGQDVLAFSDTQTITGSFNSSSGVLTLTGTDSVTNYEAALRSVTYQNTEGDDPNLSARTISFVVNDGSAASTTLTSTVNVTAINDAPTLSATTQNTDLTPDAAQVMEWTRSTLNHSKKMVLGI